eukprot:251462_1
MSSDQPFLHTNRINENTQVIVDGYIREAQINVQLFIPNSINGICYAYCCECYSLFCVSSPDIQFDPSRDIAECTSRLVHDKIQILATSSGVCVSVHLIDTNNKHIVGGFNDCNQLGFKDHKLRHINIHPGLRMNDFFNNNKNMRIKYITNSTSLHSKHMFVKTNSNEIYSFGDNDTSQCGYKMNGSHEHREPKLMHFFVQCKVNIIDIKKGYSHTLFLSDDGMVYGCGSNLRYQMGLKHAKVYHTIINVSKHMRFPKYFKQPVKQMECQSDSSFFVDSNDILYGVGNNDMGSLGVGGDEQIIKRMRQVNICNKVKQFKCGCDHVCLMDHKYNIITFGSNASGQCGVPFHYECIKINEWGKECLDKPTVINSFFYRNTAPRKDGQDIDINNKWQIICGYYSTYIIDDNFNFYVCGANATGGCLIDDVSKIYVPRFVDNETISRKYTNGKPIVSVVGSYEGVYLITR